MNDHEVQAGCFGTLFTRKTRSLTPTSKLSRQVARSADRNINDLPEKVGNVTVWFPWY